MKEELIKNKKLIIIGGIFILIVFCICFFYRNKYYFIPNKDNQIYQEIKKYESNKFIPIYITIDDIVSKYLNDYKNLLLNDRKRAYEVLNENYRNKKFGTFEKFNEFLNNNVSLSTYNMLVDKYTIGNSTRGKLFYVYDKSGRKYIFIEKSIMNYEIYLDDYTVEIK